MFKLLLKSNYPSRIFFSNRSHFNYLCTIYKRFQEKNFIYFREFVEKDLVHFVSDSIFKRLKFDCSSSETVSNQKIKIKNCFLDGCVFLEIRLTHGNQLLPNITKKNKLVTTFSNLFK